MGDVAGLGLLFEGAALWALAALAATYCFAYFLKGAFGVGALTPVVLVGSLLLAPHHAVMLGVLANAGSQFQFIPEGWRFGDRQLVKRVAIPNMIGTALGVAVFANLDGQMLAFVLGVALGLIVLADLLHLIDRIGEFVDLRSRRVAWSLAAFSGLVTGVTGAGGLFFLAVYLRLALPDPRSFRATTFLLSAVAVLWRTSMLAIYGFVTLKVIVETLLLGPAILFGGWLGARFYHALPKRLFFLGVQILLLVGSAGLIIKGWPWS
jgi:uncharacterized membrane protein YfcA